MTYTLVTGNTVYPTQTSYQNLDLTESIVLSWPSSFTGGPVVFGFNDINPTDDGYTVTLPDATLASLGVDVIFRNISSNSKSFDVLNNGSGSILTLSPGEVIDLKIVDNSTSDGQWSILPFLGGFSGVPAFTAASSDSSIVITNGTIGSSGGTIDFALPSSINNLNQLSNAGIAVITSNSPDITWGTVSLVEGSNISIDNSDGTSGSPIINLSTTISGIASLDVGGMNITGDTIASTVTDQGINIDSNGTGSVNINGMAVDVDGNVTGIESITATNLNVSGALTNSYISTAWVAFTDGISGIAVSDSVNLSEVTSSTPGAYRFSFETEMSDTDYAVFISVGTNVGTLPSVVPNLYHALWATKDQGYVEIIVLDASGQPVKAEYGVSIMIMSTGLKP